MREKLAQSVGDVFWTDLRFHVARDAVIIVADELTLIDVGAALASNDVAAVDAWIQAGLLTKPTADDLSRWPLAPGARFSSLIIAPFVLVHRPRSGAPS
jgi:hypothetical protein